MKKKVWLPLMLQANGKASVFSPAGTALAPQGAAVDCPQTSDEMWQAFEAMFVSSTENPDKPVRLILGSEGLTLAMTLNLDTAQADITLARVPEVAK